MRVRQLIVFLLIVLVPLAVAAWLGLKVARDERAVRQHEFRALVEGRLSDVDTAMGRAVQEIEAQLLERVLVTEPPDTEALRALRRKDRFVRELFVVDAQGTLVFPPEGDQASAEERAFRAHTAPIWRQDAVLYEPPVPAVRSQAMPEAAGDAAESEAGKRGEPGPGTGSRPAWRQGDSILRLTETHDHGWIAWYWEEGIHLLLWRQTSTGGVIGAEVERMSLLAHVLGRLPTAALESGRIVLVGARGEPLHQWGPHEPARGEQPVASLRVQYPLDAWRLLYFAAPAQQQAFAGQTERVNLIVVLAAVGIGLLGLAFLFYRDYSRKLRDAAERVTFVTQVSHELKTPLANIRLYAELMEGDLDDEDERSARRLRVIVAESQRLTRLINNILAFAKQQKRQLALQPAWIELDPVVAAIVAQFEPALAAKGIEIEVQPGAAEPVYVDADALGQIVANLVGNVEKYAASGRWIGVSTRQEGGRTFVRVTDRGPGIPRPHRDRIFRPFYRVSDKLADGITGTGIGLAIARQLARQSGGDLVLVPTEQGACFELVIEPAPASAGQPDTTRERPAHAAQEDNHEGADR